MVSLKQQGSGFTRKRPPQRINCRECFAVEAFPQSVKNQTGYRFIRERIYEKIPGTQGFPQKQKNCRLLGILNRSC